MTNVLILLIPSLCYFFAGINNFKNKDLPMSLVYVSYAMANLGMIWYELTKKVHG